MAVIDAEINNRLKETIRGPEEGHGLIVYLGREAVVATPAGAMYRCVPVEKQRRHRELLGLLGKEFTAISNRAVYVGSGVTVPDFDSEIGAYLPAAPVVLIIRDMGAGDVIMSTPAVRALRRRLPEAHIIYATLPRHFELLEGNPDIDDVVSVHDLDLESDEYDLIINWARCVENYSVPRNRGHRINSFARMLGLKIAPEDRRPIYSPSAKDRGFARDFLDGRGERFIGYVMQAAAWNRTWPLWRVPELLVEFSRQLPEYKVVLIDRQEEAGFFGPNVVNACGRTQRFGEAAALLGRCELSVVQDTGLAHACGAMGLRTLALIGSIPPEARFGYYENFHWIHPAGRVPCCPCWDWQEKWSAVEQLADPSRGIHKSCKKKGTPECLETISPEEIAERCAEIIGADTR